MRIENFNIFKLIYQIDNKEMIFDWEDSIRQEWLARVSI